MAKPPVPKGYISGYYDIVDFPKKKKTAPKKTAAKKKKVVKRK